MELIIFALCAFVFMLVGFGLVFWQIFDDRDEAYAMGELGLTLGFSGVFLAILYLVQVGELEWDILTCFVLGCLLFVIIATAYHKA